jgi:hypothetical protein
MRTDGLDLHRGKLSVSEFHGRFRPGRNRRLNGESSLRTNLGRNAASCQKKGCAYRASRFQSLKKRHCKAPGGLYATTACIKISVHCFA